MTYAINAELLGELPGNVGRHDRLVVVRRHGVLLPDVDTVELLEWFVSDDLQPGDVITIAVGHGFRNEEEE